jgi:hypothetical protein
MLSVARLTAALISLIALLPSLAVAQATKAGVVTTLEGHVTVTRVTLAPQPLKFKDDVFVDDKVTTGDQSIARMLLGGKAVVTVRERSTLTITEVPGKATIDLQGGKIALAVAKDKMRPGESIEIRAANAVAGIRGTVVVAEVSSAAAQAGGAVGPTGTLWVLKGQIDAFVANQPGNPVLVGALQQFRGGNVSNIVPGQMAQILQGLSTGRLPHTQGGDAQAKENGVNAAIALANSFTGVGSVAGRNVVPPPPVVVTGAPILPGNRLIKPPPPPPPPAMPPPPSDHCHQMGWRGLEERHGFAGTLRRLGGMGGHFGAPHLH